MLCQFGGFGAVAAVSVNNQTKTATLADVKTLKSFLARGEKRSPLLLKAINNLSKQQTNILRLLYGYYSGGEV